MKRKTFRAASIAMAAATAFSTVLSAPAFAYEESDYASEDLTVAPDVGENAAGDEADTDVSTDTDDSVTKGEPAANETIIDNEEEADITENTNTENMEEEDIVNSISINLLSAGGQVLIDQGEDGEQAVRLEKPEDGNIYIDVYNKDGKLISRGESDEVGSYIYTYEAEPGMAVRIKALADEGSVVWKYDVSANDILEENGFRKEGLLDEYEAPIIADMDKDVYVSFVNTDIANMMLEQGEDIDIGVSPEEVPAPPKDLSVNDDTTNPDGDLSVTDDTINPDEDLNVVDPTVEPDPDGDISVGDENVENKDSLENNTEDITPDDATSDDVTPDDVTPDDVTPDDVTPDDENEEDSASDNSASGETDDPEIEDPDEDLSVVEPDGTPEGEIPEGETPETEAPEEGEDLNVVEPTEPGETEEPGDLPAEEDPDGDVSDEDPADGESEGSTDSDLIVDDDPEANPDEAENPDVAEDPNATEDPEESENHENPEEPGEEQNPDGQNPEGEANPDEEGDANSDMDAEVNPDDAEDPGTDAEPDMNADPNDDMTVDPEGQEGNETEKNEEPSLLIFSAPIVEDSEAVFTFIYRLFAAADTSDAPDEAEPATIDAELGEPIADATQPTDETIQAADEVIQPETEPIDPEMELAEPETSDEILENGQTESADGQEEVPDGQDVQAGDGQEAPVEGEQDSPTIDQSEPTIEQDAADPEANGTGTEILDEEGQEPILEGTLELKSGEEIPVGPVHGDYEYMVSLTAPEGYKIDQNFWNGYTEPGMNVLIQPQVVTGDEETEDTNKNEPSFMVLTAPELESEEAVFKFDYKINPSDAEIDQGEVVLENAIEVKPGEEVSVGPVYGGFEYLVTLTPPEGIQTDETTWNGVVYTGENASIQPKVVDGEVVEPIVFTCEAEGVTVTAEVNPESGIPAEAVLHSDKLVEGSEEYNNAIAKVRENLGLSEEAPLYYIPYDVYFINGEERIEPQTGMVKVRMEFTSDPFAGIDFGGNTVETVSDEAVSDEAIVGDVGMEGPSMEEPSAEEPIVEGEEPAPDEETEAKTVSEKFVMHILGNGEVERIYPSASAEAPLEFEVSQF